MSPIGRVFIVINLVLAGAFVMIAGTFLQRHTDYKGRYEQATAKLEQEIAAAKAQQEELNDKNTTLDRELRAAKSALDTAQRESGALADENKRLQGQLADISTDLKSLNSHSTTIAEAIANATADSKQALDMATKANEAKTAALDAKEAAEAELSGAKTKIASLEESLAGANAKLAQLEQTSKEQEIMLSYVKTNYPGIIVSAQPDLRGVVEHAQDRLLTVRVTENPAEAEIKPGYTMSIYNGNLYKGDAVITEVDGDYAFCTMTKQKNGMSVTPGDAAATNLTK